MIYFISDGEYTKIGYTSNDSAMDRLRDLQVGNARKLRLIGLIEGDENTERTLHEVFSEIKAEGEWFKCPPPNFEIIEELGVIERIRQELVTKKIYAQQDYLEEEYPPIEPHIFQLFAERTVEGERLSLSAWAGGGKPFSRSQFEALRNWLIYKGYARWVSPEYPQQGFDLTLIGQQYLYDLVVNNDDEAPSP